MRAIDPKKIDGVCLFAIDAPGVREEIDKMVDLGIAVCTIVSDVSSSSRQVFVGLDNVAAGRTTGRFISRLAPDRVGSVGVITGSNQIRNHIERLMGLNQALTMYRPDIRMLPALEGNSGEVPNRELTKRLLCENQDLLAKSALIKTCEGDRPATEKLPIEIYISENFP